MRARGRVAIDRDQEASPFSAILWRLCECCAAHAAALVDKEGETVDYAGRISPYEIRVAAAELRLVLAFTRNAGVPGFSDVNDIRIRTGSRSYAVIALGDGYAIVLELVRHSSSLSLHHECARTRQHSLVACAHSTLGARQASPRRHLARGRVASRHCAWPLPQPRSSSARARLPRAPTERRGALARARAPWLLVRRRSQLTVTESAPQQKQIATGASGHEHPSDET